jgi:hypothetical protein
MSNRIRLMSASVPRAARLLGLSGLLPTIAALLVATLAPMDWLATIARIAAAYAAVILSFLGGAWWGLASCRVEAEALKPWLVISVLPSLAAWALMLMPMPVSLWGFCLLFAIALLVDRQLHSRQLAPPWWWSLRWPLSSGMAGLHVLLALLVSHRLG